MPLVPAIAEILRNAVASAAPPPPSDEQASLAYAAAQRAGMSAQPPSIAVAHVEDKTVAGRFAVRLYDDGSGDGGLRPGVVYLHGGGWALGDLDYQDAVCRRLATAGGAVVINVDYRLAPEHRFPAALDDAYDATVWLVEHTAELGVDPTRVAVMGSSSGANLAAAVALRARDTGGPALALHVLVYPPLDSELSSASYRENGGGEYLLSTAQMMWFWQQYAHRPEDRTDPWASPRHASDLAGLPPAIVETAEYDPLRDDGEAYAARLREAGVDTELRRHAGLIHGYVGLAATVPEADAAVASVVERVRDRLHTTASHQKDNSVTYTAIVDLRLKPDDVEGAGAAVKELLAATRSFAGNLGVDVLVDEADPAHWLLVESWASAEANAAYSIWRAGEGKSTALGPYLAGTPAPSKYHVMDL